ncbi:hypothetical protein D9619_000446 [Psilocybe cf. subviscida]|uniref:aspartyl aminopeptidase n=1 Tax=Psilocybe cf. subviscida TaxID=2480587 RepID=A0A8H5BHR7_9AGAR|nr:hypothetical protein D9619_000446 [Psilocybe cf. subviscida]
MDKLGIYLLLSLSPCPRSGTRAPVTPHVDSSNLKVRPVSKRTKAPDLQVNVETYGGGVWHSWLDRDLSLAGRVVIREGTGAFISRLITIDRPILRIPTLAIHRAFNQGTEFVPILGLIEFESNATPTKAEPAGPVEVMASSIQENHHPALLSLITSELSIAPEEIHDFELSLYDTQPAVLGGLNSEFIFSPRMDNLVCLFCAAEVLAELTSAIGSVSTSGAESSLIPSLLNRLSPTPASLAQSIARSFLISADMGHALHHPNYTNKHEENHKPWMNDGIVIKTNAKQRYATDAILTFSVKQLVERKGGRVQELEIRNDMCVFGYLLGSTVGLMLSKIDIRTVDVGNSMLSMYSIRETAGSHDVQSAIDLFAVFSEGLSTLDKTLTVD